LSFLEYKCPFITMNLTNVAATDLYGDATQLFVIATINSAFTTS